MARGRHGQSCGLVHRGNGAARDIVVAGGLSEEPRNSVEIFSVEAETWRQGEGNFRPDLYI